MTAEALNKMNSHFGSFVCRAALLSVIAVCGWSLSGCKSLMPSGAYRADSAADCLPAITLTDQYGKPVSLAALKGKPVLVDFIYTSCPGPCEVITNRMAQVADQLGPELGSQIRLVSITVDPEHDGPSQLLYFAKHQNADRSGWLFLTGTPTQIDAVLANFNLVRRREPDGTVDHIIEFFLVGPNGREQLVFDPNDVRPQVIAGDLERAARQG
jgi:protein SCO1/2